jgi:hypothetical protein
VPKRSNHKPDEKLQQSIAHTVVEKLTATVTDNVAAKVDEAASRKLKEPALAEKIDRLTERILDRVLQVI